MTVGGYNRPNRAPSCTDFVEFASIALFCDSVEFIVFCILYKLLRMC